MIRSASGSTLMQPVTGYPGMKIIIQWDPCNVNSEIIMSFLKELWAYLKVRKKYWLIPLLILLALLGGVVVLSQGSAVAPFIYTLF